MAVIPGTMLTYGPEDPEPEELEPVERSYIEDTVHILYLREGTALRLVALRGAVALRRLLEQVDVDDPDILERLDRLEQVGVEDLEPDEQEPVADAPEPEVQEPDVPASCEANAAPLQPREPTPEALEDQRRGEALSAATRAATVMASEGTSDVDLPHVPGGLEGIAKAIGEG